MQLADWWEKIILRIPSLWGVVENNPTLEREERWDWLCIIWYWWGPVMSFQHMGPIREHRWLVIFCSEVFSPYTLVLPPKTKTSLPGPNPQSVSGKIRDGFICSQTWIHKWFDWMSVLNSSKSMPCMLLQVQFPWFPLAPGHDFCNWWDKQQQYSPA